MEQKPHIFIATPMYGGMATMRYVESMLMFMVSAIQNNVEVTFSFISNESLITRGRNKLVNNFLSSNCTHLLFIDADIGFKPIDVLSMLKADKDIIGGVYPKKSINWKLVAEAVRNGVPLEDLPKWSGDLVYSIFDGDNGVQKPLYEPLPVIEIGTGFMLIKRHVFEVLKERVPVYKNNMKHVFDLDVQPYDIYEYFATSIDQEYGTLLSEDYHFCKLWRDTGGEIFIAPWVDLIHTGTYEFEGRINRSFNPQN